MQEMEVVFLNDEFVKASEAKVSVFDRGFIFGDGIYEVVPVVNAKIADKEEFWERFERSLAQIELQIPYTKEEFENILEQLIIKNSLKEGGLYMQVTRGVASRNFALLKGLKPTIMAFAFECKVIEHEYAKNGVSVISTSDLRWKRRDIKSISLLAQCLAKEEAIKAKVFEAFMVENALVTEASSSSAFIIKDKTLITKPFSNEILPGIRRKNILKFAKELDLKVDQRAFSMKEVYEADEVFISAATFLILGVIKADSKVINDGKVGFYTQKLREKYVEKIQKEVF
ncbi:MULTISPECIES: D-amino acid aminotransferase [unclassified Campylobacter]|uniref:D-amino acid aminotransferase n=1 Tax=unclassified Campylobacter TaxID=2593542 RepID=UPI00180D33FE|nr:D-amino acid aminotransferase [Campylobacter sp. CNRCH_2015_0814]EAH6869647.1 D-amino acid aminotransferase [Campylobacter lari]MCR8683360.1 D-amino acid aminotransferase [Campylobacter sp. LMG 17559]EGK7485046.1 D-amino acid aminotransferase [Campylobacter lari]MCV3470226.1 D-amino acid aminotransferase [Campylobacter sp. CNRCH_2015_0814]HEC1770656.1 D-amino acid aminotransferase [Campylobacter lari]